MEIVRLIITMSLLLASNAVAAGTLCPNLTGHYMYQSEDGQIHISITQHKCDRITIIRESGYLEATTEKHVLELNGQVQADSVWIGGRKRSSLTSARFIGSELHIQTNNVGGSPATFVYSLNADRDLLEGMNRGEPSLAKRQP